MRIAFTSLSTAACVFAVVSTAVAADLPARPAYKAPPAYAPPVYTWTGCYVGGQAGGKWGRAEQTETATGDSLTGRYDIDGWVAGGTVGCNFQSGSIVFGVEGDAAWADVNGDQRLIPPFNPDFLTTLDEQWLATLRGRIGFTWGGSWMIYATGGVAWAGVKLTSNNTVVAGLSQSEKDTLTGWTVGGGFEVGLGGGWSAKAEYLYIDFGDNNRFFDPPAACCVTRDLDLNQHLVRIGINYRWGWGAPVVARY